MLKVPDHLTDMQVVLLSDILPTAWHACEMGEVHKGDVVAIWGAGPGTLDTGTHACSMLFGLCEYVTRPLKCRRSAAKDNPLKLKSMGCELRSFKLHGSALLDKLEWQTRQAVRFGKVPD